MADRKHGSMHDSSPGKDEVQASQRPPTSADVARLANVSRATVSFVLNNIWDSRVSEETQERVLRAAEELGYVPHAIARSLRAGRSNLVLMPFFDWPYDLDSLTFLQELGTRLDELGYTVMLQMGSRESLLAAARGWASLRPTGVILSVQGLSRQAVDILYKAGTRAIIAFGEVSSELVPTMVTNFTPVGECAARHLLSLGHRHLAAVVPRDRRILRIGIQRLQGVEQVSEALGLQVDRIDLAYDREEAARLASRWRQGPRPTAVFTYNDEYGMLLMRALQDVGLSIPDDIALVGCDNLPLCELLRPRLTSIHTSPGLSARAIAAFFDGLIQGRGSKEPPPALVNPKIVARESSQAERSPGKA
jgi:DNA-binding LacI/PurR family transcriptional regulator